jgi:hypothetical protein
LLRALARGFVFFGPQRLGSTPRSSNSRAQAAFKKLCSLEVSLAIRGLTQLAINVPEKRLAEGRGTFSRFQATVKVEANYTRVLMAFLPAKRAYCIGCYGHAGIEERRHDIQMCRLGGETESGVKRLGRESPAGEGLPDFRQVTITTRNMKCVDISCICAVGWHSINKTRDLNGNGGMYCREVGGLELRGQIYECKGQAVAKAESETKPNRYSRRLVVAF